MLESDASSGLPSMSFTTTSDLDLDENTNETLELAEWATTDVKPTTWLIDGILPTGVCSMLGAEMKSGKTWLLCDMAVACACGKPWLGTYETRMARSIIFSPESSPAKLHRRLQRICWGYDVHPREIQGSLAVINVRSINLLDNDEWGALNHTIREWGADLIILDPLINLNMAGIDENSAEMMQLMTNIRALQRDENTIMVAHHVGKAWRNHSSFMALRGHSSIGGWADGLIHVIRPSEDQPERVVRILHRDEEESTGKFGFTIDDMALDDRQRVQYQVADGLSAMKLQWCEATADSAGGGTRCKVPPTDVLLEIKNNPGYHGRTSLARQFGCSENTISNAIKALNNQGHNIIAIKQKYHA